MNEIIDFKPQKIDRLLVKQIFNLFMRRRAESHKGENGRVLIIGGSKDFYGAPILNAMAALGSGADMIYLLVPSCIADNVKNIAGPDFIVRSYKGENFNLDGAKAALELCNNIDSVLIGSGFLENEEELKACDALLKNINIPTILDAGAIKVLKNVEGFKKYKCPTIITPHKKEFANLFGEEVPSTATEFKYCVRMAAYNTDSYIFLKGAKDYIISPKGHIFVNTTGNPGMTSGGTGDVLAGAIAGLAAQKLDMLSACNCAGFAVGSAGDTLYKNMGYFYSSSQVAKALPLVLKKLM